MNLNKISSLIKKKRKSLGMTQTELANKLFVTEKAVSRWETGRGTPDISLLIPLSKELNIDVSELLNGEENNIEKVIEYNEKSKKYKYNFQFKLIILFYILSILTFLQISSYFPDSQCAGSLRHSFRVSTSSSSI